MKNNLKLALFSLLSILMMPAIILSQNHLDVEGDAWIKEKLEINTSAPNAGEFIWNPTGLDLRFFTGFAERLRINGTTAGGDIMIFEMDTITSAQDTTAGNVVRLSDGTLALRQYKVGDMAQGGIVFWVDETGEHGLVADTADISTGIQWYNGVSKVTNAKGDGIRSGQMNTMLIIAQQTADNAAGSFAALICANLIRGSYGDWYLPSKEELNLMWKNLHRFGCPNVAPNSSACPTAVRELTHII